VLRSLQRCVPPTAVQADVSTVGEGDANGLQPSLRAVSRRPLTTAEGNDCRGKWGGRGREREGGREGESLGFALRDGEGGRERGRVGGRF
jgi:hypothetical protein